MKKRYNYILILLLIIMALPGCKSEEAGMTELEMARQELLDIMDGSWTAQEVRKDNVLLTDFENFSISFSGQSYNSTDGSPVWPSNGDFSFADEDTENTFTRTDGNNFTVISNAEGIQININFSEPTARQGIEGNYQFSLKQN